MQYLLIAAYSSLFVFLLYRLSFFKTVAATPFQLSVAFVAKVVSGILLGLVYTYLYTDRTTSDTFKFFDDSLVLFNALYSEPKHFFEMLTGWNSGADHLSEYYARMSAWNNQDVLFNDNKTLVRLNVLFHFFSLHYYYVHVVFINMLSFTGLFCLLKVFAANEPAKARMLFYAALFMPSVLFWGSGLLKDGLLLFALGVLLYHFTAITAKQYTALNVAGFLFAFWLLLITKFYVLIIVFPALIAWRWSAVNNRRVLLKFATCYAVYFLLAFNVYRVSERFDVTDLVYYKLKNFKELASSTAAKSVIDIPQPDASAMSYLLHSPGAVLRVLTRPYVWEAYSPLLLLSAIENLALVLSALYVLIFARKKVAFNDPLFWFSLFFCLLMLSLIGLITPILGAMVRYKVPALLFILFLLIKSLDQQKLPRWMQLRH